MGVSSWSFLSVDVFHKFVVGLFEYDVVPDERHLHGLEHRFFVMVLRTEAKAHYPALLHASFHRGIAKVVHLHARFAHRLESQLPRDVFLNECSLTSTVDDASYE